MLNLNDQQAVTSTVERAALALGIHNGVAKGDMVMTPSGPKVIEIAGRLSGGFFSTVQIPLATGVNFVEKAIKLCLGIELSETEMTPKHKKGVAIRYLSLPSGTIQSISGIEAASSLQGVKMFSIDLEPGDQINPLQNHTERAGFVITTADTKAEAIQRAYSALATVEIVYS
jgi:biotin carboxylase